MRLKFNASLTAYHLSTIVLSAFPNRDNWWWRAAVWRQATGRECFSARVSIALVSKEITVIWWGLPPQFFSLRSDTNPLTWETKGKMPCFMASPPLHHVKAYMPCWLMRKRGGMKMRENQSPVSLLVSFQPSENAIVYFELCFGCFLRSMRLELHYL